jgi:Mrp family chromosome partitioning ATPase
MASIIKNTILVVRENETSNKVLLRTLMRLREVEAKALGIVINHSRVGTQSYFYYYPHYRR